MSTKSVAGAVAAAAVLAVPAAARADTLVVPAPGASNLVAAGGYLVWSEPAPDNRARLVVRAPDGAVTRPAIATFPAGVRAQIGSTGFAVAGRRTVAVYERDGDIAELDLKTGRESTLRRISSSAYRERLPSIQYGRLVFVRSGGRRDGVYYWPGSGTPRRISAAIPSETAFNGTRAAWTARTTVVIKRVSGKGRASVVPTLPLPHSLVVTRYRVGWLIDGGQVFMTPRFGGSGGPDTVTRADHAKRDLPPNTNSVALRGGDIGWYLDPDVGIFRVDPRLF